MIHHFNVFQTDISSSTRVTSLKRENKNAPAVMRSDRPVKRLRIDSNLKTNNKGRDPRSVSMTSSS